MPSSTSKETDSFYLPPLDRCFSRSTLLISWRSAHASITQSGRDGLNQNVQSFLTEDLSIKALAACHEPPKAGNGRSKAIFETRTAAINVTPSTDSFEYDINQIKEDVRWLASKAHIDEITALRVAILEWQTRPASRILDGNSEEEAVLGIRPSLGGASTRLKASSFGPSSAFGRSTSQLKNGPTNPGDMARHTRLLRLLQEEQEAILAVAAALEAARKSESLVSQLGDTYNALREISKNLVSLPKDVAEKVFSTRIGQLNSGQGADYALLQLLTGFEMYLQAFGVELDDSLLEDVDPGFEHDLSRHRLQEVVHLLRLIFIAAKADSHVESTAAITMWFRMMDSTAFLRGLNTMSGDGNHLFDLNQTITGLISFSLLSCSQVIESRLPQSSSPAGKAWYGTDKDCSVQICKTLINAASHGVNIAAPALLAWGTIASHWRRSTAANRRSSIDDDEIFDTTQRWPSGLDEIMDIDLSFESPERVGSNPDPIMWLAQSAIDGLGLFSVIEELAITSQNIFDSALAASWPLAVRMMLLDTLRHGCTASQYGSASLEAAFNILRPPKSTWNTTHVDALLNSTVQDEFLKDTSLRSMLLQQALARYPLETSPLLHICQSLSNSTILDEDGMPVLTQALRAAANFTQVLPKGFTHYELLSEDRGANSLRLTQDLSLFGGSIRSFYGNTADRLSVQVASGAAAGTSVIPQGTQGTALTESRPPVVMWDCEHSILAYLATSLAASLKRRNSSNFATQETLSPDDKASIIRTFTSQVEFLKHAPLSQNAGNRPYQLVRQILEEASDGLGRDQDIISVIADTLEQDLPSQVQSRDEVPIETMISCVQFLTSILPAMPGRVWPIIARNGLLGLNGTGGKITRIVSAYEMSEGRYGFLESCLAMFEALVTDVISNAISRISQTSSVVRRFEENLSFDTMLPQKAMATLLQDFSRLFSEVLRDAPDWKFVEEDQRCRINSKLMDITKRIIRYAYGYDHSKGPALIFAEIFGPSAEFSTSLYLGSQSDDAATFAVIRPCQQLMTSVGDDIVASSKVNIRQQLQASINLISFLLTLGEARGQSSVRLQYHLFQSITFFLRLYASGSESRSGVTTLLARLVRAAGATAAKEEPPTLFGQVGTAIAEDAIAIFSDLDKPLDDEVTRVSIWELFGAAVGNRQQWFTTYLLTGSGPQKAAKSGSADGARARKSVLETGLDHLLQLKDVDTLEATVLLQFVLHAVNHWPWSIGRVQNHKDFLYKMAQHTTELDPRPKAKHPDDALRLAYRTKSVSLLSELFAMYLYTTRRFGDNSFREHLSESICFFKNSCVEDPAYSQSLHSRLQQNFESKFAGCQLNTFKRSLAGSAFGDNYYYDLNFANEILESHVAWRGGTKRVGFETEFKRANINLSLVEAQVQLISSWRILALELSAGAAGDRDMQKKLAYVAHECLAANRNSSLQAEIFEALRTTRLELALPIMQLLTDLKVQVGPMQSLLSEVWKTITQSGVDVDVAFVGEDAPYYRTLLRLLLLSLSPHTHLPAAEEGSSDQNNGNVPIPIETLGDSEKRTVMLEISRDVVSVGFRSLAAQLHEAADAVLPSDLGLVTAIFHSLLRVQVKDPDILHNSIANLFARQNLPRYATALFSWSDRLTAGTGPDADPIHGELSISLLVDMSAIPPLASSLAASGLLSQLNSTTLMNYYRRPHGTGPQDEPQRIHKIWTHGILPLCLNLALSAGDAFVPELVTFLNNFAPQLERAATSLDAKAVPTPSDPGAGCVTLNMACEAHTLALLSVGFDRARDGGGADGEVVPQLHGWDKTAVREELEAWVSMSRNNFRDRVVPGNESEVKLWRTPAAGGAGEGLEGCENRLEEMVLGEIRGACFVLGGNGA